jgi:PPE-repeat protein
MAAAAAYETAHAMTVPPVSVTANRTLLQQLVATNVLGQNTPSIATTEAQHSEMWVQDAIAMTGYHAQSTAAAKLADFTPPPNPTNPGGEVAQAAAVATANSAAAGTQTTTASNTLQNLVNSLFPHSAATTAPPLDAGQILADPNYNLANQAMTQLVTNSNLQSNNICALWRGVSGITGLQRLSMDMTKDAAKAAQGAASGAASAAAGAAGGAANAAGGLGAVAGGLGGAGAIGGLSVPPSWAPPVPAVTNLGPVSGGTWQPIGPSAGILGPAPMTPPSGMPGMPGVPAAGAAGAGFRGFGAPRYGAPLTVMPRGPIGG